MVAQIPFNPNVTTVANGTFNVKSTGLVQGTAYPDPAIRYKLRGGILAETETIPMWGGVGIYADIPGAAGGPVAALGAVVGRATALTGSKPLLGFSVFDQAYGMINNPQSPVQLAASYMQVNYYALGSGARIAVACSPNLVNLRGEPLNTQVSWDFENQQLEPYSSTTVASGTYTSGTGAVSLTTAAAHGLNPGDTFELSSMTGTGAIADLDGEWVATEGTTGETLNFTAATGLTLTITGGTVSSGGALDVDVLDVQSSNCMTVNYNSGTGFASWDFDSPAAVIVI